ncbi:DUF4173 domain-containing protein [Citromicrobium bathyomarinum]|uniref:DUF4153 domain-containing protein n=1 Tax=Citromicrobium bathyomarinum TaxID=72174 RepID=UPI00315ACAE9
MLATHAIPAKARFAFLAKGAACLGLLALSDVLFYGYQGGSLIGLFALAWLVALVLVRPAVRRGLGGCVAIFTALLFALTLIHDPSLLGVALFFVAIGTVALLPRHSFDHAGRWGLRLGALGLRAPVGPVDDLLRVSRLPGRRGWSALAILLQLALPLIGGGIFLALFAHANPVLGSALGTIRLPGLGTLFPHAVLIAFTLVLVWPTLRPRAMRFASDHEAVNARLPDLSVTTMLLTLVAFNAVFALENALDIAFLWSGAALPEGVTLADYAHRGAYTLIATALMAGLFVLVALQPGSAAARNPTVRRLVLLWIVQNVFLVASSVLRLFDYIDAYSLTVLRIAALMWMGLVATGLVLICWRFMTRRSAAWLINANAIAAALVLTGASIVDLGAVAARWNVDHLHGPAQLDLCYLSRQGSSALIPLIELRDAPVSAAMRDRAVYLSAEEYADLARRQANWQAWTWRGERRLAVAEALLDGDTRQPLPAPHGRHCDGALRPPPPPSPALAEPAPATMPPSSPELVPTQPSTPPESVPAAPAPLTQGENP